MNQKRGIAFILAAIFLVLYYSLTWEGHAPTVIEGLAVIVAPILCIIGFILAMLKE